jgi:membrane protease YdiL (CAAX protease family)
MKKFFTLTNIAFYILIFVTFFVVGILYAKMIDAAKGQMLAGGAIVLGYDITFGSIAFVAFLFIAFRVDAKIIKRLNWGMLVILAIGYVFLLLNHTTNTDREEFQKYKPPSEPTAPAEDTESIQALIFMQESDIVESPKKM